MKELILKFCRPLVCAIITLISIIVSILITVFALKISGLESKPIFIFISVVTPTIIAPLFSWYLIGLIIKIDQLEKTQRNLATYDALTGLMTRGAFLQNANNLLNLTIRNKSLFSLAYLDIDNFKTINDVYGHAGGDLVLKYFASNLDKYLRKSDLVGRVGGEEFALALPDTGLESAMHLLDNIRDSLKNSVVNFHNKTIQYTVSIGVVLFDENNLVSLEQLAIQADDALYQAKKSGKDRVVKYDSVYQHKDR